MRKLTYRYKIDPRYDGKVYRPYVPVTFKSKSEEFSCLGWVDTGSDVSFIPKDVAELLGLSKGPETKVGGIGGDAAGYESFVDICIMSPLSGQIVYTLKNAPVVVLPTQYILLGRQPLCVEFEVTVNDALRKISMKKIDYALKYTPPKQ